ncbi:TRAP transporter small permease [Jeotgalicoccus halotolerans]|uniref:TRAP transporter small permease n=1 Tax=Jeotgalicoccus halotolerans TaxID=157227 RepID=UPI003511C43E
MKKLVKIEDYFVGIMIIIATCLLFTNIILRYFFNANTTWAEEFVRYSMIWITFIGMAICFRKGIHFSVDFLLNSLTGKGNRTLQIIINLISIFFISLLIFYGAEITLFNINSGQITPSLEIDIFWIYLAIPVGAGLSLIHIITNTILLFKNEQHV